MRVTLDSHSGFCTFTDSLFAVDEVQLVYEADWVTELTQGNLQRVQGLGLVVIQNFPHICILQASNFQQLYKDRCVFAAIRSKSH